VPQPGDVRHSWPHLSGRGLTTALPTEVTSVIIEHSALGIFYRPKRTFPLLTCPYGQDRLSAAESLGLSVPSDRGLA